MTYTVTAEVPLRHREASRSWARSTSIPDGLAAEARIVPLAAEAPGKNEIVARTEASKPTVIAEQEVCGCGVAPGKGTVTRLGP